MVPAPAPDRVPVFPPGLEVAVYAKIGNPPLTAGGVNATVAVVCPVALTAPMPGAPGGPNVVTDADGADASEVPEAFVAVTVNVYAVLGASPVTVMVPAAAPDRVPVFPPGLDVAVYFVIGEPPSDVGAVKRRTTTSGEPVAATCVISGAPGTVAAVKVNVAVPVCVPWVAVTAHVAGPVAVSDAALTAHPSVVVA
jgi:hypothetical protein